MRALNGKDGPSISVEGDWLNLFQKRNRDELERQRAFGRRRRAGAAPSAGAHGHAHRREPPVSVVTRHGWREARHGCPVVCYGKRGHHGSPELTRQRACEPRAAHLDELTASHKSLPRDEMSHHHRAFAKSVSTHKPTVIRALPSCHSGQSEQHTHKCQRGWCTR